MTYIVSMKDNSLLLRLFINLKEVASNAPMLNGYSWDTYNTSTKYFLFWDFDNAKWLPRPEGTFGRAICEYTAKSLLDNEARKLILAMSSIHLK